VGLSIGTLDDAWALRIEIGTPRPSARLRALHTLQDAGVPTFGMLCPIFPDVLVGDALDRLVDAIRPGSCEHVWAEPYNDRTNWEIVRDGYARGSDGYRLFSMVFGERSGHGWSAYALELFQRLRAKTEAEGWFDRLVYLLYEEHIAEEHVAGFGDLRGILLQSKPAEDGLSQHPGFAEVQRRTDPRHS
jgi:DNA repair photolyase